MKKLYRLFLIIFLATSIQHCKSEKEEIITNEKVDKTLPQQQLENIFTVETDHGDTIRTIKAKHMDNYPKKKLMIADTVFVTDYNKDGTIKSKLYCDNAEIDKIKDIFICKGNVKVITDNGTLETPYLIWDKKNDNITAKDGIKLKRGDNILQGETLQTDSKLEKIKITKVSAKGKLEQKDIPW